MGPTLLRLEVMTSRQRVAQLDQRAADVEHHLASRGVRFEKDGARRIFVAPRRQPRAVGLADLLAKKAEWLRARPGRFVLGEGIDGEVVTGDLSDGSTCHLLVGGQTGSGKSVLLRAIVSSLAHFHPPSAIRLLPPARPLARWASPGSASAIAAHLEGPIFFDAEAFLPELGRDLVGEQEGRHERYRPRQGAVVEEIDGYNGVAAPASPPTPRGGGGRVRRKPTARFDKATRQSFLAGIQRLGAKAPRAAATSAPRLRNAAARPGHAVLPGADQGLDPEQEIALKVVQVAVSSRMIILDRSGPMLLVGGDPQRTSGTAWCGRRRRSRERTRLRTRGALEYLSSGRCTSVASASST